MKLSRDNLVDEDKEISHTVDKYFSFYLEKKLRKFIQKVFINNLLLVDKNTLKLEKNRESAKRARLRKKLYIKLLEN
jgi:hypothetical protein